MASNNAQSVLEDYKSSLDDLTFNSKPMINVLTMLAEENEIHADGIVRVIRNRIKAVDIRFKIPSLYLLDSILKNVGGDFIGIIAKYMIEIFTNVFEHGDEKVRLSMFKLRNTWPQFFPSKFLHELDLKVKELDPNWPVAELQASAASIHINPKFLIKNEETEQQNSFDPVATKKIKIQQNEDRLKAEERRIQEQLKKLQEEQLRLQQARLEEERRKQEDFLKKQQAERERLLEEQQKQIQELKKQQELLNARDESGNKKVPKLHSPIKTQLDSKKSIDPRLGRKLKVEGNISHRKDLSDEARLNEGTAKKDVPQMLNHPPLVKSAAKIVAKPITTTEEVSQLKKVDRSTISNNQKEHGQATSFDVHSVVVETEGRDASVSEQRIKKRILQTGHDGDEKREEKNDDRTFENEGQIPKQPPVKKIRSDEPTEKSESQESILSMEVDRNVTDGSVISTDVMQIPVASSNKATDDHGKENRDISTAESTEEPNISKFRRPNRSEWRKLMIEKAKLERRQRIPSEKELPREMRMENHDDLLEKLKARLENGEINSSEYISLSKQLGLMYEVQRSRESIEQRRKLSDKKWGKDDSEGVRSTSNEQRSEEMGVSTAKPPASVEKASNKILSQKEMNQDLIRQLKEKRMNVEREQRESERRLDREKNREHYRPARGKRGNNYRGRAEHRSRRDDGDRDSRRERDKEYDWRDRRRRYFADRERGVEDRQSYRDRPHLNARQPKDRRRESPLDDRKETKQDARHRDTTKSSDVRKSVIENKKSGSDNATEVMKEELMSFKEQRKYTDNKKLVDNTEVSVEVRKEESLCSSKASTEIVGMEGVEKGPKIDAPPESRTSKNNPIIDLAILQDKHANQDGNVDIVDDLLKSETDPDVIQKGRIVDSPKKAFRIPKRERKIVEGEAESGSRITDNEDDDDLSSRKRRDAIISDHNEQQTVDEGPFSHFFSERRLIVGRGRSPFEDNEGSRNSPPSESWSSGVKSEVPLSWRTNRSQFDDFNDPERRQQTYPDLDRRPGPDSRPHPPNGLDHEIKHPITGQSRGGLQRDFQSDQGHHEPEDQRLPGGPAGRMRPRMRMRPPFRQRGPDFHVEEPYGQRFRGPRARPPRFSGPRQRGGPRMRGRRVERFGRDEFLDSGFREGENVGGNAFHDGEMDSRVPHNERNWESQEMRRNEFYHEENIHRYPLDHGPPPMNENRPPFEEPPRFIERPERHMDRHMDHPDFDRMDNRYNEREPPFNNFRDPSFRPPFDEGNFDRRINLQPTFRDDRRYPPGHEAFDQRRHDMNPDKPMYRERFPIGQGFDENLHIVRDYEHRRLSPVPYQQRMEQGPNMPTRLAMNEPESNPSRYKNTAENVNFMPTNPLLQMIHNAKAVTGEPGNGIADSQTDSHPEQQQASQSFMGVKELFQKLVSTGVIATSQVSDDVNRSATPPPKLETNGETIPEMEFVMEDLKKRYVGVVNSLYIGSQCSSCGLRFPENDKQFYRDHLDWHFRVNRKEKENKKSVSRPWFYSVEQWLDMDDVVDFEESAKSNVFATETKSSTQEMKVEDGSCSVLGGEEDSICDICFESFEQFWDESLEEWRYKDAVRINGKTYHAACYNDADIGECASGSDYEMPLEDNKLSPLIGKLPFLDTVKQECLMQIDMIPRQETESFVSDEILELEESLYSQTQVSVKEEPNDVSLEKGPDNVPSEKEPNDVQSGVELSSNTSTALWMNDQKSNFSEKKIETDRITSKEAELYKASDSRTKESSAFGDIPEASNNFAERSDEMTAKNEDLLLYSSDNPAEDDVDKASTTTPNEISSSLKTTEECNQSEQAMVESQDVTELNVKIENANEELLDVVIESTTTQKEQFNLMSDSSDQVIDNSVTVDEEMKNSNKNIEFEGNPQS